MADQIPQTVREPTGSVETSATIRPTPLSEPAHRRPIEGENRQGIPQSEDPDTARIEIEETRARMSETIDEIEGTLLRRKDRIQSRLDIMAPVRESPWQAMGIALGAGLLLGFLTGEGERGMEEELASQSDRTAGTDWERRASILEARTRRLVRIAREREEELDRIQEARAHRPARDREPRAGSRMYDESGGDSRERVALTVLDEIRDAVLRQVTRYLGSSVRRFARQR